MFLPLQQCHATTPIIAATIHYLPTLHKTIHNNTKSNLVHHFAVAVVVVA
jgi:hypothetical protein